MIRHFRDEFLVVLGGMNELGHVTSSALVLPIPPRQQDLWWQYGPSLLAPRSSHAAVVCGDFLYGVGGWNGTHDVDTMEQLPVSCLFCNNDNQNNTPNNHFCKALPCRLSTPRNGCAAVAVHNRYVVVVGG